MHHAYFYVNFTTLKNLIATVRIGYSQKGWTDGKIGAEWIKIFDKQTKHKVKKGEYRLLIVDGHNITQLHFSCMCVNTSSLFSATLPTQHTSIKGLMLSFLQS
jgi:hypothetical protein